jgi:hypothetical protein
MEDQLGALGLTLNAVVLFDTSTLPRDDGRGRP